LDDLATILSANATSLRSNHNPNSKVRLNENKKAVTSFS